MAKAKEQQAREGANFGKWTIVGNSHLAKGGNSKLYLVRDAGGQERVLKLLNSNYLGATDKVSVRKVKRFFDEIRFLRDHRDEAGILPSVDDYLPNEPSAADRPWYVMPRAVPVRDVFPNGPRQFDEIVNAFASAAETLARLHDKGIYNRDIKPDNLLLLDGNPVVGDFGLADFPGKQDVSSPDEQIGSVNYIAPEMRENAENKQAGPADVYSVAKAFWVMATGQRYPLDGQIRRDSDNQTLSALVGTDLRRLDTLLHRCTSGDPETRPTMQEFAEELRHWQRRGRVTMHTPIDLSLEAQELRKLDVVIEESNRSAALANETHERLRNLLRRRTAELRAAIEGPLAVVPPRS